MPVLLLLSSGINQTRIRRCILRLELLHRLKVGRVSHDFGELFDLLELIQLGLFFFGNSTAHNFSPPSIERRSAFTWLLKRTPRTKHPQRENHALCCHVEGGETSLILLLIDCATLMERRCRD